MICTGTGQVGKERERERVYEQRCEESKIDINKLRKIWTEQDWNKQTKCDWYKEKENSYEQNKNMYEQPQIPTEWDRQEEWDTKRKKVDTNKTREILTKCNWYYLPTPPLGQDMTQGQFFSGV